MGDKKRIKIVKVDLTCSACPSQWDMWDSKGRQYYARYRWGHLRIAQNINSYGDGKALISISWGEPGWGGCMPTSTMKQLTKKVFKYKD